MKTRSERTVVEPRLTVIGGSRSPLLMFRLMTCWFMWINTTPGGRRFGDFKAVSRGPGTWRPAKLSLASLKGPGRGPNSSSTRLGARQESPTAEVPSLDVPTAGRLLEEDHRESIRTPVVPSETSSHLVPLAGLEFPVSLVDVGRTGGLLNCQKRSDLSQSVIPTLQVRIWRHDVMTYDP